MSRKQRDLQKELTSLKSEMMSISSIDSTSFYVNQDKLDRCTEEVQLHFKDSRGGLW